MKSQRTRLVLTKAKYLEPFLVSIHFNVSVDIEEGVGNSHPSHALPNSTGPGHADSGDADGQEMEGEKSVLQVNPTT